jgi:addiction module HigA family antidote
MRRIVCPTRPGEILKEDVLPELGITVTEAANQLGVTRVAFSRVINSKAGISPDMALRLATWLGSSPESWINMQSAYDLYQASQKKRPNIKPVQMVAHV